MGSLQPDPSMMDLNLSSDAFDPASLNNLDMSAFSDDVAMDMGNAPNLSFDAMDARQPPPAALTENGQQTDSSESVNTINANAVGAGPLPSGFGTQISPPVGSTLTEFTKRRNWSQRVLEELKDMLYILTSDGRLLYASPSSKTLTGYEQADLKGKLITEYIHPDDSSLFIREFNESIATGNPLRFFYRFRTAENKYLIFECHGHPHLTNDVSHMELTGGPVNAPGFCRGFFMMARPYPTRNSELLDSFLEHKIENVRLQARIAALKREEAEEAEAQAKHYHKKANGQGTSLAESISVDATTASPSLISRGGESDVSSMPPPAKPSISNIALTREALDEANAFARPDSITDKMARYEGSSHVDSIEMLTGLRYREGERAQGISTGGSSPALIRGDAGIDIPADKTDPRYSSYLDKKPKKVKSADEYVCTDCGTLDSPEWRRGPNGPKTLCNACGLRWAKKEKKKSGGGGAGGLDEGPGNGVVSGEGTNNSGNTMTPQMSNIPTSKHNSSNESG